MRILFAGIIGLLFSAPAYADAPKSCSFSANPLLGWWYVSGADIERSNHTHRHCGAMILHLECGKNNELVVEWGYDCGRWMDWLYGDKKSIPVQGEKLLGQDGYLKNDEFYWDSLIPKVGGSKITLRCSNGANGGLEIGEDPKYYYPENIFRGDAKKVAAPPFPLARDNMFSANRLHGAWTGKIRILGGEKEIECLVPSIEFLHDRFALHQTSIYLPNCAEDVNFYVGPNFFRGEKIFDYDRGDSGDRFLEFGTARANGWSRTYSGYVVRREEVSFEGDNLTYRLFTAEKEYRLELRRP